MALASALLKVAAPSSVSFLASFIASSAALILAG